MGKRQLSACALSLAAHAGLAVLLIGQAGGPAHLPSSAHQAGQQPLRIRLAPLPASKAGDGLAMAAPAPTAPETPPPQPQPPAAPTTTPIPALAGIPYLPLHQLTQAPLLASGMIGGELVIVPGVRQQAATVRLALDDEGNVRSVAFEEETLSDDERQRVLEALLQLKFSPGKIGRIAVPSDITLRILLDNEIRS